MFQGPTYWQSIKKKWATLTATTNTGRFFCTSRKFGRPRDGKQECNLNCWVLLLSMLFLRVVTQCLNGNTSKMMRNQFFGSLCMHTVIRQLDARPMGTRVRDGDEPSNPTFHCIQISLGQYKVKDGTYKGSLKTKQKRCKYCRERKDI